MKRFGLTHLGLCALVIAACAPVPPADRAAAPGTAPAAAVPAEPTSRLVVAGDPLAAEAGREMLRRGGTAVDAAVAAQAVLALVEPQSSGFGGGGFMVHYDAGTGAIDTYDGRETAPAAATPDMFLRPDGTRMAFMDAVTSGRAVGVPGLPRMLKLAHERHGKLEWGALFEPAIKLAEEGFPVSERLAEGIATDRHLRRVPASRAYFYPDGRPPKPGDILRNPAFAHVLRATSGLGVEMFYEGATADAVVETVRTAPDLPQRMTRADIAGYEAKARPPVCAPYRMWLVCGMGPPSSGGLATLQILGMLQEFDLGAMPPFSPEAVHLIAEASARAFADRAIYVADPDFIPVPLGGMLDPAYLELRAAEIDPGRATPGKVQPGMPGIAARWAPHVGREGVSTTHLSIIDEAGNAVALTSSIEQGFGSRLMAAGMLLNNELTDFSFRPEEGGAPVANAVEPGKRPRSSMSPTIVFDGRGRPLLVVGSPGGSRIIGFVVKTLVAALDWGMDVQAAVAAPNFVDRNGPIEIEKGSELEKIADELRAMGHEVETFDYRSGIHAVAVTPDGLRAGVDPRRGGAARGD